MLRGTDDFLCVQKENSVNYHVMRIKGNVNTECISTIFTDITFGLISVNHLLIIAIKYSLV